MALELDDIPTVQSAGRLGRKPEPDSSLAGAYTAPQVNPLDALGSIGLDAAFSLAERLRAGVFPTGLPVPRPAPAGPARTYTTYYDCGPFNYDGTCAQPCFGPPLDKMSPFYCATCSEQQADPQQNPPYFWHFTGNRGTITYWGETSICAGKGAWKWKIQGACGSCATSSQIRCHDGYKQVEGQAAEWTICEGLVFCDDKFQTCS